jgi:alginate production protein
LAQQLLRRTTVEKRVDVKEENVIRLLADYQFEYVRDQQLKLVILAQDDHSGSNNGGIDEGKAADPDDANLFWLGFGLSGDLKHDSAGVFKYSFNSVYLRGEETQHTAIHNAEIVVAKIQDISAWSFDLSVMWQALDERAYGYFGYAQGSGDSEQNDAKNHNFSQTGLQKNEDDFKYYGDYFDPELSNIKILTAAIIFPFRKNHELIVSYHCYRQGVMSDNMGDANIDLSLTGTSADLGEEMDIRWKMEVSNGLSLDMVTSIFRAGAAVSDSCRQKSSRIFLELVYEF